MINDLYKFVQARPLPEAVAKYLLDNLPNQTHEETALLKQAAGRRPWYWSSMNDDFHRPSSHVDKQIALVPLLFGVHVNPAAQLRAWGFEPGKSHRLPKKKRRRLGIYKSARWFNKRRRLLDAIINKQAKLGEQEQLYLFTRISKSGLAVEIPYNIFAKDVNTAALIAYLTARMNRRSVFTNKSQDRAFDKLCEALLSRCEREGNAEWLAIAYVMPDQRILARLSQEEKGLLVGRWYTLLFDMASKLERIWSKSKFDRLKMIVRRGDDSSTWNAVAGAWNTARSHWISLVCALGATPILDTICPGKVMRLMAADVASWHRSSGGDIHPDTHAWATLPPPWEVLRGETPCGIKEVAEVCAKVGADFASWSYRKDRKAVEFKPTPELVHGVEVSSPQLAAVLRKAGVFSGKPLKATDLPQFVVHRDSTGAASLVTKQS